MFSRQLDFYTRQNQMSNMKDTCLVLILIGFLAAVSSPVNGLQCYTCVYDSEDAANDANYLTDCNDNPSSSHLRDCGPELSHAPWRCQKSVKSQNGVTRVQRICHAARIEPNCYNWTMEMKRTHKSIRTLEIPEGEICYCEHDGCNDGSKLLLHNFVGLIFLAFGVIILMS